MIYALDTNAIVHYIHSNVNVCNNFHNAIMDNYKIVIPKMADYEIRRGFCIKPSPRKEKTYATLLRDCAIINATIDIWDDAIPIYAGHFNSRHTAGEIDILIAALCLQNDYTLVTNNANDFKNVDRLKWIDWTQPA